MVVRAMPKRQGSTRTSTHDPFPGTPAEGVSIKVAVEVEAGGGDDRGRSSRQSRLYGERAQPVRGLRALGADGRRSSIRSIRRARRTRAAFAGFKSICATAASPGVPRHPSVLLRRDDQYRRPRRQPRAERRSPNSPTGSGWPRPARCIPPSCGVISGVHDGKPFVNEVYLGCTGGAGTPHMTAG